MKNALLFPLTAAALIGCAFFSDDRTPPRINSPISPTTLSVSVATPAPAQPTFPPLSSNSASGNLDLPLVVRDTSGLARAQEPVTSGVPIPRSLNLTDLTRLRLLDAKGNAVPAQFTPLARWGGSPEEASRPVRWLLLDFQADVPAMGASVYHLVDRGGPIPSFPRLAVTETDSDITINTGAAQFDVNKQDGRLSAPRLEPLYGQVVDLGGTVFTTSGPVSVTVALRGAMRVSIQVKGAFRDARGASLLNYTDRYWFYAGQPAVRLFHTLENNNLCPLGEYEQLDCFDIGSGGSVEVKDVSIVLPTRLGGPLRYEVGAQDKALRGELGAELMLYQDSSGTDYWNRYLTFQDWDGKPLDTRPRMQTYVTFRGYRVTSGEATVNEGNQAAGWLSVAGQNGRATVGVRDFWQNFPKALRASPSGDLEIGLLPQEFGPSDYAFSLRAGEHKTHELFLSLSPNLPVPVSHLFARAPAAWYVESGAFGLTALPNKRDWPDHEEYVEYQLATSPNRVSDDYYGNLPEAIARSDFYGIFDYGDWPIDYEGFEVAPLNTKYDNDYGMWLQWSRGGDARWFSLAEAADRHLADIDILHNRHDPRHWGDGIAFGHSEHDEPGFTNPHRNRNSGSTDTAWGMQGLLLTYYLTGYEKARESAQELADSVEFRLRNDAHLCSYFPDCNGAGYALDEGLYQSGSRLAANSLSIAVSAYRATGEPRYLAAADAVVDWAKPSAQPYIGCTKQPADERGMKPFLLNLYLRALADYIEVRGEFALPDSYGAQASFLAYANWLRTCPWLDLPPIDTGARAAYPYEWWFDGRIDVAGEDNDNSDPSINNWLLLGADALAYAHHLSGDADYLDRAARLFRTGSRDPWYEGDANSYAESKETVNSITFGHTFLHEWSTNP